ncbi:alpha-glucan family phosphorylase [Thermatribacter velox]|uniref:Alpha-glucan family phosphorylase n=1 Tax=Thermatribacter velox TaxID=3039681 RepID=A0ABZ2YE06_9BACT
MEILNYLKEEEIIAYFSMEIALFKEIPTYSGGLGVLAGDTVRSAADLSLPFVAITLLHRKGYFRQELTPDGNQIEHPVVWDVERLLTPLPQKVRVTIEGREVVIGAWVYVWRSVTGGKVPVIFLDTDLPENVESDRAITHYLYGGDRRYRLKQEIVLGIGGVRMLKALELSVRKYHINEGHAALLALELLRDEVSCQKEEKACLREVRNLCVFTTHTPVEAGHDRFPYDLVREVLGEPLPIDLLKKLGGKDELNMTLLALNLSGYVNGVAKRHSEVSRNMFPGYVIHSITNGVHTFTWTSPAFRELYDRYIPGWAHEPELLARVDVIPDELLWEAHQREKKSLIELVYEKTGILMEKEVFTLGFARRMTAYKRPTFIFADRERLIRIAKRQPFQVIFAGKAHPQDWEGKRLIQEIFKQARELHPHLKIAFLEDYDLEIAKRMVSGVDLWLNTPQKPFEASGTSGMKAAHNGVLHFSVLDGWWIEGCLEGITGWSIGSPPDEKTDDEARREVEDFYGKLEYAILPTFYNHREHWIRLMKNAIGKLAPYFNSHRMMKRYLSEAYFHQPALFTMNNQHV